ncbi:hypothetical protein Q4577_12450 [Marinovum sp. 2_MG-2023]|uniref:hypothetical protein n=1 Tax=unclassified Marinovum TaxID=2647166 RepID=UPI0026E3C9DA|nr:MULTISPECIES: hypothetical protein [unclassified Marinovum]MDO6730833.1 hypothetical protein [Marinovum sp. 2_MG-2023]MDO6779962.1 hypothetical protein [Marinovum sp. 1_MG-2023]
MAHSTRRRFLTTLAASGVAASGLAGCSGGVPGEVRPGTEVEVMQLTQVIQALGHYVNPAEAYLAASLAYSETYRLALAYEIEDPPLTHNSKVNLGIKPRGLCYHWADDLERRLKQERFQTLALHRAVANWDNIRLEHSTVIISQRGDDMYSGIVLDPWRKGGSLTWVATLDDARYRWTPRAEVWRIRRQQAAR